MSEPLYLISILWKDDTDELTIICPEEFVRDIVNNLPIMVIERIKITTFIDAI